MWSEQKRERFQQLRHRQAENQLTEPEQIELTQLMQELEDAEAEYLKPATDRLRQEQETVEVQNRCLEALVRRKQALALRLREVLAEARTEQRAIESELAAVLTGSRGAETEE